jgi:hypothetical protein
LLTDRSPYESVLGDEFHTLHPRLTTYFSNIPAGSVGRGVGTFDVVGTPRRWLWPVLVLMGRAGMIFPVWQRSVPFTVINRPTTAGNGEPAVAATRRFLFRSGTRVMADLTTVVNGELVDRIGTTGRLQATFTATVTDSGLDLRSTSVAVRIGRSILRIPVLVSPVVRLSERFDDDADRQLIRLTVDAPLLGRLYEYSGTFRYSVQTLGALL